MPFQSRYASPEMVTRSTFPTRTAFQEPTVEVSRGLQAEATGSITDTVWPDLRIKNPELAAKVPYPMSKSCQRNSAQPFSAIEMFYDIVLYKSSILFYLKG